MDIGHFIILTLQNLICQVQMLLSVSYTHLDVYKRQLDEQKRVDGRGMDDIRPLASEVGVIPRVHGSGMFTRGPVSYTHLDVYKRQVQRP